MTNSTVRTIYIETHFCGYKPITLDPLFYRRFYIFNFGLYILIHKNVIPHIFLDWNPRPFYKENI